MDTSPIPYGRQNITEEDIRAVTDVLRSDYLTQGPAVDQFELAFARYVGSKYAVVVNSGTAALHLACMALDLKSGQKILTTPNSFVATSNCALYCGAGVEFIDIDPKTYLIDLNLVEDKLKKSRKDEFTGIIPVDFAGLPLNMEELKSLAEKYNLWVIEDACHALGAKFIDKNGTKHICGNGQFADCSVFSFHPVKHITTGEGGMITTNSEKIYKRLKQLRTHGITKNKDEMHYYDGGWYYEMQELGYNYRLPDILCALGASQLKRIEGNVVRRREIAARYNESLKSIGCVIQTQQEPMNAINSHHLFPVEVKNRNECYQFLRANNIFTQVHYIPIPNQPFYKNVKTACVNAQKYYNNALSLPMFPELTMEMQNRVISALRMFSEKHS
jgi:UDP-4-amino-4,6-dideoxy-N-acetyl-beta-L-altrosamine transaminase